jgi:predicted nucleic acid-binding protein
MTARVVLDSSVIVAAMRPPEPGHGDAVAFLERLRDAEARGAAHLFAPPELWFEVRVAAQKAAQKTAAARGGPPPPGAAALLAQLAVTLVPISSVDEIDALFTLLARRTRGKAPFTNATDLVYVWVAWRESATLITLDHRLLKYHGVVCDVTQPAHAYFR